MMECPECGAHPVNKRQIPSNELLRVTKIYHNYGCKFNPDDYVIVKPENVLTPEKRAAVKDVVDNLELCLKAYDGADGADIPTLIQTSCGILKMKFAAEIEEEAK